MEKKIDLNGVWKFNKDPAQTGERESWQEGLPQGMEVTVPHIWQTEGGSLLHYTGMAWYEKEVSIDQPGTGKKIHLHFAAVDYEAMVWINGKYAGSHEGGFTPFSIDITDKLNETGQQRIVVRVYDPQDNAEIPIGKQGSWYTRVSGIWQDVWLEINEELFIESIHVTPDCDNEEAKVTVTLSEKPLEPVLAHISCTPYPDDSDKDQATRLEVTLPEKKNTFAFSMKGAEQWSPDHPALYEIKAGIKNGEEDSAVFGMRHISFSEGTLYLNGKPLYLRGALDQAYYPDTIYSAPSDEYIINEIKQAKKMGLNMLRKHIKIELPRYLYWADRLGMLIWAEPPNYIKWTKQGTKRFEQDLEAMIQRDYNHPSIIIWSLYNEEWGLEWTLSKDEEKQTHVEELFDRVKQMDPSRLICDNSGWIHVKTDINDYHRYFTMPEQKEEWEKDLDTFIVGDKTLNFVDGFESRQEPVIVSEFGMWGLPDVEKLFKHYGGEPWWFQNQGDETHNEDYKSPKTAEVNFQRFQFDHMFKDFNELTDVSRKRMFRGIKSLIQEMRKRKDLSGYVVTEFTDVEWETNGWLDYLRQPKFKPEEMRTFNGEVIVVPEVSKRNAWCGDTLVIDLYFSNHSHHSLKGDVHWGIPGTDLKGSFPVHLNAEPVTELKEAIRFSVPEVTGPELKDLRLQFVENGGNNCEVTEELMFAPKVKNLSCRFYPAALSSETVQAFEQMGGTAVDSVSEAEVILAAEWTPEAAQGTREGKTVVFFAEQGDEIPNKGYYSFKQLPPGESWQRSSSMQAVNKTFFGEVPIRKELGWEMEGLYPDCIIPFTDYSKEGGRTVYLFGNPHYAETSDILGVYFEGWIGQVGGSFIKQSVGTGTVYVTTWKLLENLTSQPLAGHIIKQVID
ncbi:glycoside hydrolase family 2 protein [Salipaludibacillus aurantiacus]|uniref:Beta-galactosidase/beta-glucuronidase n=1 Tax=Salipaludibacillus aurantiacus TaxID=1601833 RepID=A0A1H9UA95_9BACI|nr:sugar-binding domain-containing protein [Salipaludibacillus aurantiacus]SES06252.1 Beta-galactosidase/beta-glucuronidase [Salipaludibacillus aurantiacus]